MDDSGQRLVNTHANWALQPLLRLLHAGLQAVDPEALVSHALATDTNGVLLTTATGSTYAPWQRVRSVYVVGGGKAGVAMAHASQAVIGNRVAAGCVAVPRGTTKEEESRITLVPTGHPYPDEGSRRAGREIIAVLRGAGTHDLVISLVSGGASAMISLPNPAIPPAHEQRAIELLMNSGAGITEVNTVRRHLSQIKGGRAAQVAYPARVWNLILSDVPGDDLAAIGSGMFVPDPTTFADALRVLDRRQVLHRVPLSVRSHLEEGVSGLHAETPKRGDHIFDRVVTSVVGSNQIALHGIHKEADAMGIRRVRLLPGVLSGEAQTCAARLSQELLTLASTTPRGESALLIAGGETTVTVTGAGSGGRNQELALATVRELHGHHEIALLTAGSDGVDGPTDAAGAYVDGWTHGRGERLGMRLGDHLTRNDSYHYFAGLNDLVMTGPTGTNVADIALGLVRR